MPEDENSRGQIRQSVAEGEAHQLERRPQRQSPFEEGFIAFCKEITGAFAISKG